MTAKRLALRRRDRASAERVMRCGLRFAAGFVLAQGKIFDAATPFGVALAASTGDDGAEGICGAAGAAVGAIVAWRLGDGFKYLAACILALVASKAFAGTTIADTRLFGAAVASASIAVVGFVFVAAEGFPFRGTVAYVCEVTLAAVCGATFPIALEQQRDELSERERSRRATAKLFFLALILLGLSSAPFFAGMTIGRIVAAVLVLSAAASGGMGAGAAAGVAFGVVFDIGGGSGFYAMCYGAAGLLAGVASGGSRLYAVIAYVVVSAAAALVDGSRFSVLYETFVASVLFMIIPQGRLGVVSFLAPDEVGSTIRTERRELAARSRALGELLSETARSLVPTTPQPSPDRVFVRTAARICKGCARRAVCWEREREETLRRLRDVGLKMELRGGAEPEDLPPTFRARCLRADAFVAGLGEEYRIGQLERRRASEELRSRTASAMRLGDAAALMNDTAGEVEAGLEFDGPAQRAARNALLAEGCAADLSAYRLPNGRLCVEVETSRLGASAVAAMGRALGVDLCEPQLTEGGILLYERGRFDVRAAAVTKRKRGSVKNGDCGTYLAVPRGRFAVALADGMGSGEEASAEATRTVRAAEGLLAAGVSAARTAELVCDLAVERAGSVFSTLDLLVLDDWTARGELVKCGAAASYLRVDGRVVRAEGAPSAALPGARPKRRSLNLESCDLVVMLTDGVCDGSDERIVELIEQSDGDAETLARRLVADAAKRTGEADDMTAVVVKLER